MSGSFPRGVAKQVIIGQEATFGTIAGTGTGKQLRRVNAPLMLNKDAVASQEILPSMQLRSARHNVRRGVVPLQGELSPGAYPDIFAGMLRRPWAAGASTGAQVNITAVAGTPGTFTRAAGSFITDGFKVGDIVRSTGWTTTGAANNNRNYRLIAPLTATVMTVAGIGDEVVAAKTAGDSVTFAVVGKKTFTPVTSQTFASYTLEQLYPDGGSIISERFTGTRWQSVRMGVGAGGLVQLDAQGVAQQVAYSNAAYFISPTAPGALNTLTGVSGIVRLNGADVALVTNLSLQIQCPVDANPVVGSQIVPEIFQGAISVSGAVSLLLKDRTYIDLFDSEAECDMSFLLETDSTLNADFISVVMNRIKFMSNQRSDSDRSIVQSMNFTALEHVTGAGTGTAFEATTITVQDSSL